jgi:transmembrane sensor
VNLKGEAWFDVTESEVQPFLIHTGNDLVIEVIGTSFTINSNMEKDEVLVRVISGKVSFYSAGNKRNKLILGKNEMGRHDISGFSKGRIKNDNFLSWKTGRLVFRDTPLLEVAESLSEYSGYVISIRGEALDSLVLTSSYEGQDLIEILEEIKLVLNIDYSIRNDTVIFFQAGE